MKESKTKKSGRGGYRPGAGRKPGVPNKKKKSESDKGVQYWTRLQAKYVRFLRNSPNAAKAIEQALDNTYEVPDISGEDMGELRADL